MSNRREVPGIREYEGPAGGWGALRATAQAIRLQMETIKAPITLMRTNQPDGFDCPGVHGPTKNRSFSSARTAPRRSPAAATTKRVTPEFFAANTVTSLLQRSDFELEDQAA